MNWLMSAERWRNYDPVRGRDERRQRTAAGKLGAQNSFTKITSTIYSNSALQGCKCVVIKLCVTKVSDDSLLNEPKVANRNKRLLIWFPVCLGTIPTA